MKPEGLTTICSAFQNRKKNQQEKASLGSSSWRPMMTDRKQGQEVTAFHGAPRP